MLVGAILTVVVIIYLGAEEIYWSRRRPKGGNYGKRNSHKHR